MLVTPTLMLVTLDFSRLQIMRYQSYNNATLQPNSLSNTTLKTYNLTPYTTLQTYTTLQPFTALPS